MLQLDQKQFSPVFKEILPNSQFSALLTILRNSANYAQYPQYCAMTSIFRNFDNFSQFRTFLHIIAQLCSIQRIVTEFYTFSAFLKIFCNFTQFLAISPILSNSAQFRTIQDNHDEFNVILHNFIAIVSIFRKIPHNSAHLN